MAHLSNYTEAQTWLSDWAARAATGSERARRFIRDAAREQRANLEAVRRNGHSGWCDVREYERSVQMLERAAREEQAS